MRASLNEHRPALAGGHAAPEWGYMVGKQRPRFLQAANLCVDGLHNRVDVHGKRLSLKLSAGELVKIAGL
jgi:hypothetical protein